MGAGTVPHLSVFAIAPLPLLVHLGSRLDDGFRTAIYQFHRPQQTWRWQQGDTCEFAVERGGELADEMVLVVNVSGTVDPRELPDDIRGLSRLTLRLARGAPGPSTISSLLSLQAFESAARAMLAELEVGGRVVRRLHVVGAMPVSAAITLGHIRSAGVHPGFAVYMRVTNGYTRAMEII